jgi:hypothetical protein
MGDPVFVIHGIGARSPETFASMVTELAVGFQNAARGPDQRFHAATSYSLMSPPRTGRRRILP